VPCNTQGCISYWYRQTKPTVLVTIGFGQVIAGMPFAFDVPFPTIFKVIIQQFKLISIDVLGVIRLGCIMDWTYLSGFYAQMAIMPAVTALVVGMAKFRDWRLTNQGEPPPGTPVSATNPHGGAVRQGLWAMAFEMVFTLLILIYPVISATVFQSFLCTTLHAGEDTEELMYADFQIACDTEEHSHLIIWAVLFVLLYPIGVPLLIFIVVFHKRHELSTAGSYWRTLLAPVVGMMKLEYWYWNPLDFFRKVILTGMMIFFKRGSLIQLALGTNIAAGFLIAGIICQPFAKRINNMLYSVTNGAILMTFTIATLLNPELDTSFAPSTWLVTILLLLTCVALPIACIAIEVGRLNVKGGERSPEQSLALRPLGGGQRWQEVLPGRHAGRPGVSRAAAP
jgi:hypothetical protein